MTKPVTSKYKRDKKSKALVSTDERGLEKHKREKALVERIKQQDQHINTIEARLVIMQEQIEQLLEQNK